MNKSCADEQIVGVTSPLRSLTPIVGVNADFNSYPLSSSRTCFVQVDYFLFAGHSGTIAKVPESAHLHSPA